MFYIQIKPMNYFKILFIFINLARFAVVCYNNKRNPLKTLCHYHALINSLILNPIYGSINELQNLL